MRLVVTMPVRIITAKLPDGVLLFNRKTRHRHSCAGMTVFFMMLILMKHSNRGTP